MLLVFTVVAILQGCCRPVESDLLQSTFCAGPSGASGPGGPSGTGGPGPSNPAGTRCRVTDATLSGSPRPLKSFRCLHAAVPQLDEAVCVQM